MSKTPEPISPINRIKITVTAYRCILCKRVHLKRGKKFREHYEANATHYGWQRS